MKAWALQLELDLVAKGEDLVVCYGSESYFMEEWADKPHQQVNILTDQELEDLLQTKVKEETEWVNKKLKDREDFINHVYKERRTREEMAFNAGQLITTSASGYMEPKYKSYEDYKNRGSK